MLHFLGSYYRSFAQITRAIQRVKASERAPLTEGPNLAEVMPSTEEPEEPAKPGAVDDLDGMALLKQSTFRHKVWRVAHKLQGFEMKFALKTVIVTASLSIPAWLDQSRDWWNLYDAWWAVVMAWITMHPR